MNLVLKALQKFAICIAVPALILAACDEPASDPNAGTGTIDPSARGEVRPLTGSIDVKRVVSRGGIEAWLVEEHSIPLIAVNFGFQGGAWLDPIGQDGLANMLAALLDEGAGDYDSQAFQSLLDENSISLSYSAGRDALTGSLFTLSKTRDLAFDLLRLSLNEPRFDDEPVERIRGQIAVMQKQAASSPNWIAADLLASRIFGEQRYARRLMGTEETLAGLSVANLQAYREDGLTKDRLKISVVGDVTPEELGTILDDVFGKLPAIGKPRDLTPVAVSQAGEMVIEPFDNPQSTVQFAGLGFMQDDPDFFPAFVANHVLGGGGFGSRLMDEVREKRGLTYGIYSYFQPMERAALFTGGVASDNARVAEAIALTRAEIDRLREDGVTEQELSDAKTYLTGAFALRFDSNSKISGQLLGYQLNGFPIDYINIRNDMVNAVTMDDVNRVLKRFPPSSQVTFVVVGQPEGLE